MKLLVTGGAGFMGSAFVRRMLLAHEDVAIVTYDALTYAGNLENLRAVEGDPRHRFVKGDILDAARVAAALDGVDAVAHFAAESHVDRSVLDPQAFFRTNVLGTQTLIQACRAAGVRRFHHVSTDEVYGDLGLDEDRAFREGDMLDPRSAYAASKAGSDHVVLAYAHSFGMEVTVSRSCNNYGPYQFPEKLIPLFITNALEDKPLPLFRSSRNRREWIHADDHAAAVALILRGGKHGRIYNIGTGVERSIEDIADAVLAALDKPSSLKTYVPDRPGHDRRYAVDSSTLRRELGWAPTVAFEDGLAATITWYKDHPEWWRDVKSGAYQAYYERYYTETLGTQTP